VSRPKNNAMRIDGAGRIDRSRPLDFTFNGRRLQGYGGDTLASALLANNVHLVARSFKYHRPRGLLTAGNEEPNALVQLEIRWPRPCSPTTFTSSRAASSITVPAAC